MEDPWLERNAQTAAQLNRFGRSFIFDPTEENLLLDILIPHVLGNQPPILSPTFVTEKFEFHPAMIEKLYPAVNIVRSNGCYYFLIKGEVPREAMGYIWERKGKEVAIFSSSTMSTIGWRQDYVNRVKDAEQLQGWKMHIYRIEPRSALVNEEVREDVKNTTWRLVKFIAPGQSIKRKSKEATIKPSNATLMARAARRARLGPNFL